MTAPGVDPLEPTAPSGTPGDGTADPDGFVAMLRPPELTPRAEPTWDDALVVEHEVIDGYYHRLVLHSPSITGRATAGQFVMITVPSDGGATVLLPRPMAIHRRRVDTGNLEVIFSVLGRGTAALARIAPGDSLLLTGPLGRGFELPAGAASVLLIAHGSGICAVMTVAEDARAAGMTTSAMLSTAFRSTALGEPDCRELGIDAVFVAEDDGSNTIGLITADLRQRFDTSPPSVIMVCGSGALARAAVALGQRWRTPVQVSVEAHMACGLGYCHGCAAPVATRADEEGPLVCRDGPVFDGYVVA